MRSTRSLARWKPTIPVTSLTARRREFGAWVELSPVRRQCAAGHVAQRLAFVECRLERDLQRFVVLGSCDDASAAGRSRQRDSREVGRLVLLRDASGIPCSVSAARRVTRPLQAHSFEPHFLLISAGSSAIGVTIASSELSELRMTLRLVRNHATTASRGPRGGQPLLQRAISRIRQTLCALRGHDSMLQFERGRMSLRCFTCGHETPGWEVGPTRVIAQRSRTQRRAA